MATKYLEALRSTIKKTIESIPLDVSNNVTKIGRHTFLYCRQLTFISFPRCKEIEQSAFYGCSNLTGAELKACTDIDEIAFYACNSLSTIHFSWRNKAAITALSGYSSKFGASNATIYFDLEAALMTLSEMNGVTYIIDGALVTDSDLQDDNVYPIVPEKTHSIVAYKAGYCLSIDSITVADETAFAYAPVWTTVGTTYTIDASSAPSGTPTIRFKYGGVEIASISGTTGSIIVPADTTIDYEVVLEGYKIIRETVASPVNTTITISNWEEQTNVTYDMSYPFTGYDTVLANLVDDNNFTIAESPTPYNSSYNTMSPSIVSGPKAFGVNSSYAYGYIKFHTPSTTDTDLLTVSVTCNAYAESSYDVGFVFIDTALHEITSNVSPSTASGNTDSTYGYMLYNSRGKSTATYSTYTKVLDADTDYYLQFAYTKDSSSNSYWDRLSITNIKFTDCGTY
jgi:hypothetical protein